MKPRTSAPSTEATVIASPSITSRPPTPNGHVHPITPPRADAPIPGCHKSLFDAQESRGFPPPVVEVRSAKLWHRDDVDRWIRLRDR
jgi:hypothetical protein